MKTTFKSAVAALLITLAAPVMANNDAQLEGNERLQYIAKIKQQHNTEDDRSALIAQINQLLNSSALLAGYQTGFNNPMDHIYSINVPRPGELSIREQTRNPSNGQIQVSTSTINIFGLNSFVDYDCTVNRVACEITHQDSSQPWLRIARDANAAREISRAMSYLIRNLQRG